MPARISSLCRQVPDDASAAGVVMHDGETTLTEDAYTKYFANGISHSQPLALQGDGGLRRVQPVNGLSAMAVR